MGTILVIKVDTVYQIIISILKLKVRGKFLSYMVFVVQVSPESADQFGELVADSNTNELLHYTEKPETFVCT